MIIDRNLKVSTSQAVTVSAPSTDVVDLSQARDLGLVGLKMMVNVEEAVTASGAATVQVTLQCDDNSSFTTPKTVISTDTIAKTDLVVGKQLFIPIPIGLDEQFLRVYYTVANGPLTAGKFSAAIVDSEQFNKSYKAVQF